MPLKTNAKLSKRIVYFDKICAFSYTQSTRILAINTALKAASKVAPFFGGVAIIASAGASANDLNVAVGDYAFDLQNQNDLTGDAAIIAGICNNIAPGSGNIVLNNIPY